MLVLASALTATPCSLSFPRGDLTLTSGHRVHYYILLGPNAHVVTAHSWRFRRHWEWLDEGVVDQRVVHDGDIVEGLTVVLSASIHIVYHFLMREGKVVTSATRPRTWPRDAIFILGLTALRAPITQLHRLLSFVFSLTNVEADRLIVALLKRSHAGILYL